jgi:hypothetical protein
MNSAARKRNRHKLSNRTEHHHYTDRTSAPVRSNAPTHEPEITYSRAGFTVNTNANRAHGGISSYYSSKERGYSS